MTRRFLVLAASLFLLAACSPSRQNEFMGSDISDASFGHQFALTDHNGVRRDLASFKNKLVVLFFGYTHCPDVCPTTLSDMAHALKLLPETAAKQVQVLFVSVDPARDTAQLLKQYVPYFHPDFLGLLGNPEEVALAAKEFRIVYRKHADTGDQHYLVDHTAGSYVLDRNGKLRLFLPFGQPPEDIAHDLKLLLAD